ncbi:MAG: hypothetical protein E7262_01895 [Lachnospiraceae bacterium]|nr:hypothetical protein [Lachnospiraceae bacterium]
MDRKTLVCLALIATLIISNCCIVYGTEYGSHDVTGIYTEVIDTVYSLDIIWNDMRATYHSRTRWNTTTLRYENISGPNSWICDGYVKVENRSNAAVTVGATCDVDEGIVGNAVSGTFTETTTTGGRLPSAEGTLGGAGPIGVWELDFNGIPKKFVSNIIIAKATITIE